jgi:CBS domain-containing protein
MINYKIIEIFTSEEVRWKHKPLVAAVMEAVRKLKTASRCLVTRGSAGSYENGEISTSRVEVLSYRMPLKIEILIPENELPLLLPDLEAMVIDGIITVRDAAMVSHKTEKHLIPRHLNVKDVMTKEPKTVFPDTGIGDLVRLLLSADLTSVPVVNRENKPVGIITQTDLIKRAAMPIRLGLLGKFDDTSIREMIGSLEPKAASAIMSSPPLTIDEDDLLEHAVAVMLKKKIKRLLVINKERCMTGILSIYDVFQTITSRSPDIRNFHARVVVTNVRLVRDATFIDRGTVTGDTPIEEVIRIIDASPLQRVAVVNPDGTLAGIVFDHDLLGIFTERKNGLWEHLLGNLTFTEIGRVYKAKVALQHKKIAAEIMRTDLVTISEDEPIESAVRLIAGKGIRYLPVLDAGARFRGMVSRDDLLRAGWSGDAPAPLSVE